MSKSPASPRTPARLSPGFFTWRKRHSVPLEATSGSATTRPKSNVSYLSTDFDATDVSNEIVLYCYSIQPTRRAP